MPTPLALDRARVLAFRRRTGALDRRLPAGRASLRTAAWAGLQDSAPRAALLSLHARVERIGPTAWEDPVFVQVWGPRYAVFVVASDDRALFTLGVQPDDPVRLARGEALVERLAAGTTGHRGDEGAGERGGGRHAGREGGLDAEGGGDPLELRLTGATGRVLIRWDGARRPQLRVVERPDRDPGDARLELARRFLHVVGPATPRGFAWWAGLRAGAGQDAFAGLRGELVAVRTPAGGAWALAEDEALLRAAPLEPAPARLLPSGDAYLMAGERELVVPDDGQRAALFPRGAVWPGAVMIRGELVGTWRRTGRTLRARHWRALTAGERADVAAEAATLPLPGPTGGATVSWDG